MDVAGNGSCRCSSSSPRHRPIRGSRRCRSGSGATWPAATAVFQPPAQLRVVRPPVSGLPVAVALPGVGCAREALRIPPARIPARSPLRTPSESGRDRATLDAPVSLEGLPRRAGRGTSRPRRKGRPRTRPPRRAPDVPPGLEPGGRVSDVEPGVPRGGLGEMRDDLHRRAVVCHVDGPHRIDATSPVTRQARK